MRKHESKPQVAPPVSYKAPSLPTLAALGVVAATAVLTAGCYVETRGTDGIIIDPYEEAPPIENESEDIPKNGGWEGGVFIDFDE